MTSSKFRQEKEFLKKVFSFFFWRFCCFRCQCWQKKRKKRPSLSVQDLWCQEEGVDEKKGRKEKRNQFFMTKKRKGKEGREKKMFCSGGSNFSFFFFFISEKDFLSFLRKNAQNATEFLSLSPPKLLQLRKISLCLWKIKGIFFIADT